MIIPLKATHLSKPISRLGLPIQQRYYRLHVGRLMYYSSKGEWAYSSIRDKGTITYYLRERCDMISLETLMDNFLENNK